MCAELVAFDPPRQASKESEVGAREGLAGIGACDGREESDYLQVHRVHLEEKYQPVRQQALRSQETCALGRDGTLLGQDRVLLGRSQACRGFTPAGLSARAGG